MPTSEIDDNDRHILLALQGDLDDSPEPVPAFLSGMPDPVTSYMDDGNLAEKMGITAIPTTVLLDKEGKVAWRSSGMVDWSDKGVGARVERLARE